MAYRYDDDDGYRADRGRDHRYEGYDRPGASRAVEPKYDYSDDNSSEDGRSKRRREKKYREDDRYDRQTDRYDDRQRDRGYDRGSKSYPQSPEKRRSYSPDYVDADDIRDAGPRSLKSSDDWDMDYKGKSKVSDGRYEKNKKRYNSPTRYTRNDEPKRDNYPSSNDSKYEFPEHSPVDYEYPEYSRADKRRRKPKEHEDLRKRNSGPYDNNLENEIPDADYGEEAHYQKQPARGDKGKGGKRKGLNRAQDDTSFSGRSPGRDRFTEDLPADCGSDSSCSDTNLGVIAGTRMADKNYEQSRAIRNTDDQGKRLKREENDDLAVAGTSAVVLATRGGAHDNLAFELNERSDRRRTDYRQMGNSTSIEPYEGQGRPSRSNTSGPRSHTNIEDDITSITIDDDNVSSTSSAMERRMNTAKTGLARKRLRRAGPLTEDEELLAVMGDGRAAARLREHQRAELEGRKVLKHDGKEDIAKKYGDLYRQTIK